LGSPKPPIGNQVRHILIILPILLLSSPLFGHGGETLYLWETSSGEVWKEFGVKETHSIYHGGISKKGIPHGYGKLTYYFGGKSTGEFRNGIMWNTKTYDKDGNITQEIENGKIVNNGKSIGVERKSEKGGLYWGERNGKLGWYKTGNEEKDTGHYVGDIENGFPNGQGTFTFADNGRQYVGEFKDGLPNGQGTFTHTDGGKYEGEFKDGKQHGQGTFLFTDGRKYVGEYKDGIIHGQGTLTFLNGNKGIGEFRENKPWNITEYDKDGNIQYKIVNGNRQ
jgi:hypothetical protein